MLLTALALAVAGWRRTRPGAARPAGRPGGPRPRGRWSPASTCRARSAGSPACIPVRLDARRGRPATRRWRAARRWARAQARSRSSCAACPDHGIGYGLLRYLNPETRRARWPALAGPQIGFNYLGRFAAAASGGPALARRGAGAGRLAAAATRRCRWPTLLEINALTVDGPEGPAAAPRWTLGARRCSRAAEVRRPGRSAGSRRCEALVRARRAARRRRAHPLGLPAGGAVDQARDRAAGGRLSAAGGRPAAVAAAGGPALPRPLRRAGDRDVYTVQLALRARRAARRAALRGGRAGAARPARRTCAPRSATPGLGRPVQVVPPRRASALARSRTCRGWTRPSSEARARRGCWPRTGAGASTSATAPLLRFTLIRLAAERHRLVLTNHHLLLDGWSTPVLLEELLDAVRARGGDAGALPPVRPYRDYLAWLAGQDRAAARGGLARGAWRARRADPARRRRTAAREPRRRPSSSSVAAPQR